MIRPALAAALLASLPASLQAADISTHVLDLARGVGGRDVPVVLSQRDGQGGWVERARARTDANGRVRAFGGTYSPADYQLRFDLTGYPDAAAKPFFHEIVVVFRVSDAAGHYHVPVVYSPYGYSTYRGN